jgi:hypothetical protein
MSSFTSDLDVRITPRKRDERVVAELLASFSYDVGAEGSGDTIVVPAGFETDFASIPRVLWIIEPPLGDAGKAAVLHDYLYETASVTARLRTASSWKPWRCWKSPGGSDA